MGTGRDQPKAVGGWGGFCSIFQIRQIQAFYLRSTEKRPLLPILKAISCLTAPQRRKPSRDFIALAPQTITGLATCIPGLKEGVILPGRRAGGAVAIAVAV